MRSAWPLLALLLCAACTASAPAPTSLDTTLESRGVAVPVTWTLPATSTPVPLVLLLHGHGGTRHEAGGFTRLADKLAAAGVASLRMDFAGAGDSSEPFSQNSLSTMAADLEAATAWALASGRIDGDRVAVVAFSMGGRVAAMATDAGADYRAMVLWAADMTDGPGHFVDRLGGPEAYAAMQTEAEANGYAPFTTFWGQHQQLGAAFFQDLNAARSLTALSRYPGALLFIHGSADAVIPHEISAAALAAATSARTSSLHLIDGADHGFGLFSDPDPYSAELLTVTLDFLLEQLRPQ
ncbi:MAG: alpha/beta fold hydrolase [Gammaproteobacteria bacterium]|nr:alpha/beta fold hydrolase [Gammaproteobacteria bacterium]